MSRKIRVEITGDTAKFCIRPMALTGTQDRDKLRKNDHARCLCGQPTCRDADLKG